MSILITGFSFYIYLPLTKSPKLGKYFLFTVGFEVVIDKNLDLELDVLLRMYWELILFLLFIFMCSSYFSLCLRASLNLGCSSTLKDCLKSASMLCNTGFLSLYFLTYCCLNIWLSLSFILLVIRCLLMSSKFYQGLRVKFS